jgi:type II secretory ATPase GspE/PulE/Tfp pilus assembly ATPase PilB-like protein/CheY-like chemotaxis protein
MTSTKRGHWLREVAQHAGLDLDLPEQPDFGTMGRAWARVVRACQVSDDTFTQRVAGYFRIGLADLAAFDPQAVKLLPEAIARLHGILPVSATESTVLVATSDPSNRTAHREITAYTSRQPVYVIATPTKLVQAIERAYAPARAPRNTLQTLVAQVTESDFQVIHSQGDGLFTGFELETPALVKLVNFVLEQGIRYRAAEIHVEPGVEQGRVRYRIDGVLQQAVDLPSTAHRKLVARLKHLARTVPGAKPEDGFPITVGSVRRRAHLVTTPSPDGELVWIRLIEPDHVPSLAELGFDDVDAAKIHQILERKDGLVLVTGPARSGTTSFIYAALKSFPNQSVISLEGRTELVVPGVTQIRYDSSAGASFAEALQKLLERSPEVLHAGEIRDLATARIVLRTAVTGHKVLASVHTPDALSGVRRLIDLGLAPGRLAESLHAVVSLRLVRRLCQKCARPFDPQRDGRSREATLARQLRVQPLRTAVGCPECAGTGYLGQIPVPEIVVSTPKLRDLIAEGGSDAELLWAAREDGMRTFVQVGLERVARGETTVEEVERVLGIVPPRDATADSVGAVLVIEDAVEDRLLLSNVLRNMGFRVLEAGNAAKALEMLDSGEELSLAIVDLYLPEMKGPDLLRSIRRSLATQSLPVIVVTGSSDPRHEFELLDAGADDYLLKPIVPERLEARVRAVLRRSGVRLGAGSTMRAEPQRSAPAASS